MPGFGRPTLKRPPDVLVIGRSTLVTINKQGVGMKDITIREWLQAGVIIVLLWAFYTLIGV